MVEPVAERIESEVGSEIPENSYHGKDDEEPHPRVGQI